MTQLDRVASMNRRSWERAVRRGVGSTKPSLQLDIGLVQRYARGEVEPIPDDLFRVFPPAVLEDVAGRDVLCLAGGGGQQTPILGLLGAHVTVLDLAEGQLAGDRAAAEHYGYQVRTVQGDMRDLSCFDADSFDLVYQATSCWIPDLREVYEQVARILRPGGRYRLDSANPVSEFSDHPEAENGMVPLSVREMVYPGDDGEPAGVNFRHDLSEVFNGLIDSGLTLERVFDQGFFFVVLATKP